jgi:hypothetical protein
MGRLKISKMRKTGRKNLDSEDFDGYVDISRWLDQNPNEDFYDNEEDDGVLVE